MKLSMLGMLVRKDKRMKFYGLWFSFKVFVFTDQIIPIRDQNLLKHLKQLKHS